MFLQLLISIPLFSSLILFVFNMTPKISSIFALITSCLVFIISLFMSLFFDNNYNSFQFISTFKLNISNIISISIGIDGIALLFIVLTTFLTSLCIFSICTNNNTKQGGLNVSKFISLFLMLESFILIVFSATNIILFYIFFEAVLIPIFFIILLWGSRARKIRASYIFFFYTLFGSLFILFGILFIFLEVGSLEYNIVLNHSFSDVKQKFIWLSFFISFAVKVPMIPFHIWLPEAHVEAPTTGSVILAGILLKLGSFGIVRYLLPLFPEACIYFKPFVIIIAVFAIIIASFTAIRQTDIKRVIAYASIAHINITILGIFSFSPLGLEGAILQILSHGLVSGALFFSVGILYDRHHTRLIQYYSGVTQTMPIFVFIFLFFTMANIGLPGTSSFVGEFIIFIGTVKTSPIATIFAASGIVLSASYSLWLFNRVCYSNYQTTSFVRSQDVTKKEFFIFIPLIFLALFFGLYPENVLCFIHFAVAKSLIDFFV